MCSSIILCDKRSEFFTSVLFRTRHNILVRFVTNTLRKPPYILHRTSKFIFELFYVQTVRKLYQTLVFLPLPSQTKIRNKLPPKNAPNAGFLPICLVTHIRSKIRHRLRWNVRQLTPDEVHIMRMSNYRRSLKYSARPSSLRASNLRNHGRLFALRSRRLCNRTYRFIDSDYKIFAY